MRRCNLLVHLKQVAISACLSVGLTGASWAEPLECCWRNMRDMWAQTKVYLPVKFITGIYIERLVRHWTLSPVCRQVFAVLLYRLELAGFGTVGGSGLPVRIGVTDLTVCLK